MSNYPIALDRIHKNRERWPESSGSRKVDKLALDFKKGYAKLKKTGEHNLYAEIQSHKDECDLNLLLQNLDIGVETLSWNECEDRIADFTVMPSSIAELFNLQRDAENIFSELPASVREKYGNSIYRFVDDYGSVGMFESLKKAYGIQEPVREPVPTTNIGGDSPADHVVVRGSDSESSALSANTNSNDVA